MLFVLRLLELEKLQIRLSDGELLAGARRAFFAEEPQLLVVVALRIAQRHRGRMQRRVVLCQDFGVRLRVREVLPNVLDQAGDARQRRYGCRAEAQDDGGIERPGKDRANRAASGEEA